MFPLLTSLHISGSLPYTIISTLNAHINKTASSGRSLCYVHSVRAGCVCSDLDFQNLGP